MVKLKRYIVKTTTDQKEYKFDTLKAVRQFVRSTINSNEVRGIEECLEIYKETINRKKIDQAKSNKQTIGTSKELF